MHWGPVRCPGLLFCSSFFLILVICFALCSFFLVLVVLVLHWGVLAFVVFFSSSPFFLLLVFCYWSSCCSWKECGCERRQP